MKWFDQLSSRSCRIGLQKACSLAVDFVRSHTFLPFEWLECVCNQVSVEHLLNGNNTVNLLDLRTITTRKIVH